MNEAKNPARERELDKTTALYNAATDYAAYVNSDKHDFDEGMKLSDALEAAAVSYAELAGDLQPAMSKTPEPGTLASATGYDAHVWLIQYANEDGVSHLHQTIFEHEVRAMAKSALEHNAVSLTILRSQNPVLHNNAITKSHEIKASQTTDPQGRKRVE